MKNMRDAIECEGLNRGYERCKIIIEYETLSSVCGISNKYMKENRIYTEYEQLYRV